MSDRPVSIHLELPGTKPRGGIPQLACENAFKGNEITHTQKPADVTCGKCKRYIAHDPKLRRLLVKRQQPSPQPTEEWSPGQ